MAKKQASARTETAPAAAEAAAREPQLNLEIRGASPTYSNLCRITGSPEEVVLDFALTPNVFAAPDGEAIRVDHRIVMGYQATKRTALVLMETIRRYEERFGTVELDPRKRVRVPAASAR